MDWYRIVCGEEGFDLKVAPPGQDEWTARVEWTAIERVCFEVGPFLASDTFYVFVKGREHSYAIPSEGMGADDLAGKFAKYALFPVDTLLEAMQGEEGTITCVPGIEGA